MRVIQGIGVWFFLLLSFKSVAQETYCAIPPAPKPIGITQSDGTFLKVVAKGNPERHWLETTQGYTVLKNKEGIYEYAVRQGNQLVPSGIKAASDDLARLAGLGIEKHLKPVQMPSRAARKKSLARRQESRVSMPAVGNLNVLCILIEYPDLPHSFSQQEFARLMNGPMADGRLSVTEFYQKSSFGKLNLKVDVTGWYKAKDKFAAYGDSGAKSAGALVSEAVEAAAQEGVDFSRYDNDKDGVVDGIIVVHSGPGGEEGASSQYVWSHMSYVSEPAGSVYIEPYIIAPETRSGDYGKNGMVGIGIYVHEFGHLLGLPDLYDTSGEGEGIGEWGLMGSGNWLGGENSPAGFSAWSKEQLGWLTPEDITGTFHEFTLKAASLYGEVYKIRTDNPHEYFLLENRQPTGIDQALNGHGLAIWHVNTKKTKLYPGDNAVNAEATNKGVGLEEADGNYDLDNGYNRGDNSDLYPAGYYQFTLFDHSTDPDSHLNEQHNGSKNTGISISNISEEGQNIKFTYKKENPSSGDNCNDPAVAVVGQNHTPKLDYYFTYTMPGNGTLSLSINDPGLTVGGTVYRDCSDIEGGTGDYLYLDGSSRSENTYKVGYAQQGETFIFHWEYNLRADIDGVEPFDFNLAVETGGVQAQDSLALVALYQQMGGSQWYSQDNWLERPVASWQGVAVRNGRVVSLSLSDLQNSLPAAFYDLTALEALTLQSYDSLTGAVDERIGEFKNLEALSINTRGLEISFMSQLNGTLAQLKHLDIAAYKINGTLPNTFSNMKKLETLSIQALSFKSTIPADIGKIPSLYALTLVGELTGSIPASLAEAKQLKFLDLSFNKLSGAIPASLAKLSKLEYLNLQSNQLSGTIPAEIFNLPYLTAFYADHNQLESIPENLFSSATLEFIDISYNNIQGNLPSSASGDAVMNVYAYLNNNKLTGRVPDALEAVSFAYLDLSHNQLEGTLPQINYYDGLDVSYNRLTGLSELKASDEEYLNRPLYCHHNQISFDDILPNLSVLTCSDCGYDEQTGYDTYSQFRPQDSVNLRIAKAMVQGGSYTISLNIDQNVADNRYAWYKDGKLIGTTQKNELQITNFSAAQAGAYYCLVTNEQLEGFALYYGGISLTSGENKQDQEITVAAIPNKKYTDAPFRLQVQTSGPQDIQYEVLEGPVQLVKDTVKIEGTGEVRIRAYHKGNDTFNPAEAVVAFSIAQASQQIQYSPPEGVTYDQKEFSLEVSSSSSLPVLLTLLEGNVELDGKMVKVLGAGEVSIVANQAGNNNYSAAESVSIAFTIAKSTQQISLSKVADQTFGAPPFRVTAASNQGLPVTLEALTDNIRIDDNQVTLLGAGPASLRAVQAGNGDIQAAEPVVANFTVAKGSQTLYFQQIDDQELGAASFELQAFSNKALPVSYRIVTGEEFIKLENNRVTMLKAGSVRLEAYQNGNDNYEAATPMQRGFTIVDTTKQAQTIIVQAEIPDTVILAEQKTFGIVIEASSTLQPQVEVAGPALFEGNQITFQGEGKVRLVISQQGNEQFNAAPTIYKEYVVVGYQKAEKASQTIAYTNISDKVYGDEPFALEATSSAGLPLSYAVQGPAQMVGNQVTITGVGQVEIYVFQTGDERYQATDTTVITFEVAKAPQTITFEMEPVSDSTYLLVASSSAKLPVVYHITQGQGEIAGDTLRITGAARVTVSATQPGNEYYQPATPVDRTAGVAVIASVGDDLARLVKLYPNPSDGRCYLEADGRGLNTHLYVYTADGRQVLEKAWTGKLTEIDLTHQPAGVYFVRFYHEKQWISLPIVLNP